jgi:hypothetical protein
MNALKVILAVLEKVIGLIHTYLANKGEPAKRVKDTWPEAESEKAREDAEAEARKHFGE